WEDPFGEALAEARARGIEVHAWVNAMLAWSAEEPPRAGHVFRSHPDWFVADAGGRSMRSLSRAELDRRGLRGEGWFLDPAVLEVRTELRRFILELVLRYPVDGVHLDYIRYPSGWAPVGGAATVSYLVGLIRDDLATVRPAVRLSAAVLPVPQVAGRSFGQDWVGWLGRGILDEAVPMVYRDDAAAIEEVVDAYPDAVPRGRLRIGVRLDGIGPDEVRRAARELAGEGVPGVALFSHNLLMEDRAWRGVIDLLAGLSGP
ncbi:MAG TPA: family 10 glycosylhydrolase, partial [Gemmatimonadota bacterium]|nr:family 10 glycosylhydrolase [Gemmatimonadota bacterium]